VIEKLKEALMSNGRIGDWENTLEQMKNPNPIKDGFTWLRHKADSQADVIDIMILEGRYTIDEIADKLDSIFGIINRKSRIGRIKSAIDHYTIHMNVNMKPHNLKIIKYPIVRFDNT
jgi:hypothetical protein